MKKLIVIVIAVIVFIVSIAYIIREIPSFVNHDSTVSSYEGKPDAAQTPDSDSLTASDDTETDDTEDDEDKIDPVDSESISSLYVPDEDALEYDEASDIVYVNNIILLFFKKGTTDAEINRVIASVNGTVAGSIPFIDQYQVRIEPHSLDELNQICRELKKNECVSEALYDQAFAVSDDRIPNDPWGESEEWTEDNPDGNNWWLEAIDAPTAWEQIDQMKTIKIGIVDSGFDTGHEDLKNKIKWVSSNNNKGEHGTHVAGIIGAEANNNTGITGVVWKSDLYTFDWKLTFGQKIIDKLHSYDWSTTNTIIGATSILISEKGVRVVNVSAGCTGSMQGLTETAQYINNHGFYASRYLYELLDRGFDFVIVQSAGNGNENGVSVDARYNGLFASIEAQNCVTGPDVSYEDIVGRVIVVGSARNDGNHHFTQGDDSNAGNRVDICAPGVNIYSTVPKKNKYSRLSGTSMAAPVVTGVAAMIWSSNNALTGPDVKEIVCDPDNTRYEVADNGSANHPLVNTYRLVNANLALRAALDFKKDTSGLHTLVVGFDSGVAAISQDGTVQFDEVDPGIPGTYDDISSWKNVISLAYGYKYIVALLEDGTVRADISSEGLVSDYGQCRIEDWRDIQQIAAGMEHTVGLRSDGTVVAVGNNEDGQCNVENWTDIVMVAAGDCHTVGLKSDGTVVATGANSGYYSDQLSVGDWTDIKQITAGAGFTAGLRTDGTVKTTHIDSQGFYEYGKPENWNRVTLIAAGGSSSHLLALRDDGSVVGIGANDHGLGGEYFYAGKWENMALLACGRGTSVGVTKDGNVVAYGVSGDTALNNIRDVRINEQ